MYTEQEILCIFKIPKLFTENISLQSPLPEL